MGAGVVAFAKVFDVENYIAHNFICGGANANYARLDWET